MEKRKTQIIIIGIALLLVAILLIGIVLVSNSSQISTKETLNKNPSSIYSPHNNMESNSVFVPWKVQFSEVNCRKR